MAVAVSDSDLVSALTDDESSLAAGRFSLPPAFAVGAGAGAGEAGGFGSGSISVAAIAAAATTAAFRLCFLLLGVEEAVDSLAAADEDLDLRLLVEADRVAAEVEVVGVAGSPAAADDMIEVMDRASPPVSPFDRHGGHS